MVTGDQFLDYAPQSEDAVLNLQMTFESFFRTPSRLRPPSNWQIQSQTVPSSTTTWTSSQRPFVSFWMKGTVFIKSPEWLQWPARRLLVPVIQGWAFPLHKEEIFLCAELPNWGTRWAVMQPDTAINKLSCICNSWMTKQISLSYTLRLISWFNQFG